jgi:myo-inositol-1-phosphate synthase
MGKINVAIVGVGNCASSLVQGVEYYKDAKPDEKVPGLMHVVVGDYHVHDLNFVAAFDINKTKVGTDLSEAIFAEPNNPFKCAEVPKLDVIVQRGMTLDGLGKYLKEKIEVSPETTVDVLKVLKERKVDVMINYLPVGSEQATKWYLEHALNAGCAVVNCIPVFIASEKSGGENRHYAQRFKEAGLPIIGDDIKSQYGATILHRMLMRLAEERGVKITKTYQLNFGGDMDFLNMLERERLESKKISKTSSVQSQLETELSAKNIHVGPSDYVPFLEGRKFCDIRMEGTYFGGAPLLLTVHLEVWDSPNSAGVVIDAVRCCKLAKDRGIGGPLISPSSYFMKHPPLQYTDAEARNRTEEFIQGKLSR